MWQYKYCRRINFGAILMRRSFLAITPTLAITQICGYHNFWLSQFNWQQMKPLVHSLPCTVWYIWISRNLDVSAYRYEIQFPSNGRRKSLMFCASHGEVARKLCVTDTVQTDMANLSFIYLSIYVLRTFASYIRTINGEKHNRGATFYILQKRIMLLVLHKNISIPNCIISQFHEVHVNNKVCNNIFRLFIWQLCCMFHVWHSNKVLTYVVYTISMYA